MNNEKNDLRGLWVFCEAQNSDVKSVTFELLGEAARLSKIKGCAVTAVYAGAQLSEEIIAKLAACGADNLLLVEDAVLADADELRLCGEMTALIQKYEPDALLLGATAFGRSLAPRLAARLQTGLTADCTSLDIDSETGLLRQTRPAFGGNLMATIICPDTKPQMATVRPKVFPMPHADADRTCNIIREKAVAAPSPIEIIEKIASREDVNIGDADILVSVGQGIGGTENIRLAKKLAEKLGGTLSASRPMIDSGLLPYARQVGQTGKTVAPKLYIALGISGAIQHMAGVASKTIVAVNTDPDAPIFRYAKYAVQGDCGAFLREMLTMLGEKN